MNQLPAIPSPGTPICAADIEKMEARVAHDIALIDNLDVLQEWRAQAAALETYLRGKELNGPMLGAQRRVEARIGQLLGNAKCGRPVGKDNLPCAEDISQTDRNRFRQLSRALELPLTEQDWRQPREKLLTVLRERYPVPRSVPTVTTKEGIVRKSAKERSEEIADLTAQGFRRGQIAKKLNVSEEYVGRFAKKCGIALPDDAIGPARKLDRKRILTETILGVDAFVSGLSMLDGVDLPVISDVEKTDLMQALSRSLSGLRKLRIRMEREYAGSNATAA